MGYYYSSRIDYYNQCGFVESTDDFAFSFVDPADVIRGSHLILAFNAGRSAVLILHSHSIARCLKPEEVDDWLNFYVNM